MPKYTPSQFRSKIRQIQQKQRQRINKYNQAVRNVKTAVNKYNQAVRSHNARVRANRQRLRSAIVQLSSKSVTIKTTSYTVYRRSVDTLHESYSILDERSENHSFGPRYDRVLDLSERETANSMEVTNHLVDSEYDGIDPDTLEDAELKDGLRKISPDLDDRWSGAVYSLNPRNPDAARHFCISSREILTQIIALKAPDSDVLSLLPDCELTESGKPTRRSKLKYFLRKQDMADILLEKFVEKDIENILQLYEVLNEGLHGSAGKFGLSQLNAIRKRTEDCIMFLTTIIGDA